MSAATAAPGVTGRTSSFVLSPVLLVMLALSVWGAWGLYRGETVAILGVGPTVAVGAAVIWLVYGAVAIGAIVLLQRYARRPAWTIAVALCWGGLAATYVAGIANGAMSTLFQNVLGSDSSIWVSGPFVEESIKAVGVIGLALVPVLRRFGPLDGLFYGVVVGAAFQVVENYLYSLTAAFQSGGSPWQAIWTNAFLRGVIGVFSHAVWTGLVGAAIGWVAAGGREGRTLRVLGAVGAFGVAVLLHGLEDWSATEALIPVTLGGNALGLALLVLLLLRLQRAEQQRLVTLARGHNGWAVVDVQSLEQRGQDRQAQHARRLALRYAYAADQWGVDSTYAQRAASRLDGARVTTA